MTNVALLARKLALLEEHLRRLRERRPAELAAFKDDPLLQDAVAFGVLVVVQEGVDIALHVASDEGWETAASYRDAFIVLERHGLLDSASTPALSAVVQLRHRIAHGVAARDVERLWNELPAGVAAFTKFCTRIAAFIAGSTDS